MIPSSAFPHSNPHPPIAPAVCAGPRDNRPPRIPRANLSPLAARIPPFAAAGDARLGRRQTAVEASTPTSPASGFPSLTPNSAAGGDSHIAAGRNLAFQPIGAVSHLRADRQFSRLVKVSSGQAQPRASLSVGLGSSRPLKTARSRVNTPNTLQVDHLTHLRPSAVRRRRCRAST